MEKKTKGWISKLFTFALLAAIIVQILYNVNPIHSGSYRPNLTMHSACTSIRCLLHSVFINDKANSPITT